MKQLPGVSRLVPAVAAVLALSLAAGASASWPVSQMEATTLWREGRSWLIEQDPWSCGMVWMNQTRGGESTYRIKSFAGADPLCSQPEQLWVGLFAKDGNAEPELFDMNCNNLPTIPASMHSDGGELLSMVVPGVDVVKHATSGRPYSGIGIRTNQTVFLMVVNVCGAPLLVEVEQEVHLQFWRWVEAAKPQLASLAIIAAATAAIVVSAWNLISMCQAGSAAEEEQEQEDEATVPLVTKDFGCGAATQTCGDAQCQTHESPLTAFLEQAGAKSGL